MQAYNERLNALVARAKKEKDEKAAKKQEAYYKIKDQVFSTLESAENLVGGVEVMISPETIKTALDSTISEEEFAKKIQSEMLNNHFHVSYQGLSSAKDWCIYIYYAK